MFGFLKNRDGSVATMTGLTFLMVTGAVAGAIDYNRAKNQRSTLQSAADTAVLAAVSDIHATTDAEREAVALEYFHGSYFCSAIQCPEPVVSFGEGTVSLTAAVEVPTSVMQVIGWDAITVDAKSEATSQGGPLEVVMILDYSSSMEDSNKYQNMRTAALQFLNNASTRPGGKIDVGIVPFARYVLTPMNGTYLNDVVESDTLDGVDVVGCVLNRTYPHAVSSGEPTGAARWPVISYAMGSDPSAGGYSDTSEDEEDDSGHTCEDYADQQVWAHPMSQDFGTLTSAISAMTPTDGTNIALGLDVGWHMLTPAAPFEESEIDTDEKMKQVAILLTDGEHTVDVDGPYGFSEESGESNIAEICTAMKASDIEMFTIAFDVDDEDTKNLLRNCATGEPYYYEVDAEAQLNALFEGIYNIVSSGQPRLTQ